jgi:hypothetical protein
MRTGGTGGTIYSLVYLANPVPVGVGATVISAKLKFRNTQSQSGSRTVSLKRITSVWYTAQATWNNQPSVSSTVSATLTKSSPAANTVWEFDVTADIQSAANGTRLYGWRIELGSTDLMYFDSSEAAGSRAAYRPVLEVTYSLPPDAPTVMVPSGNRAVSLAKPVVRFNFGGQRSAFGAQPSTGMQALQVQINPTNTWTSPAFDSGTVTTTVPELDLSTTAYAGLADGSSTYWRARVQNEVGQWSAWSAGVQFQRLSKGTLTLDNPPVGGNVTEPTPPVLWTFTGRTQAAYQVLVTHTSGYVYWDSGKVTSTADSVTVPTGVIRTNGLDYKFVVRVWDNQDRETTVNDPAYVEISRVAQYVFDNTVDGVTGLTATLNSPEPGVTLSWSRATAPDNFVLWRDGKIAYTSVNPSDWNTGATTYAVGDPYADSGKAHTWFVQAIVNGAASETNPTVTATPKTGGVWLAHVPTGLKIHLIGDDQGSWDMPEQSTVIRPLGGTKSVLITQALGGYEGSLNLIASTHDGMDVNDILDDLWTLKGMPGQVVVLTLPTMTIQAVINELVIKPTPYKDAQYDVSFKFYEQEGSIRFDAVL